MDTYDPHAREFGGYDYSAQAFRKSGDVGAEAMVRLRWAARLAMLERHEAAAEQVNIHVDDAGAAQAGTDFGPDVAVVRLVSLDKYGIVLQVDGEHAARYHPLPMEATISHFSVRVKAGSRDLRLL